MARLDVSPTYTHAARRDGVGRRDVGLANAFFMLVDGMLHVVTDPDDATHSWELFNGYRIIAPYRAD